MKNSSTLIFLLFVSCCLASEQNVPYSCRLLPTHNNSTASCMPIHPHFELGHAYQNNYNFSAQSSPEFQSLDQFAINYFTLNQCLYNANLTVQLFPETKSPNIVFYENFTDLYNNQTCNIIKYTPKSDDVSLSYQVSSNQFTCRKHNIILPRLFEKKEDSYRKCLFNKVKYLDNSIDCNIAHIFHYSAKQLFDFYENPNFQGFISNHVVHAISNLGDQDWDFPPFGDKQWYFNFNFMFEMTLDINEPSTIGDILKNFQNVLPVVQKYRKTLRPWFVAIASQSPYKLDQTGQIALNETAYGTFYDNLKSNKFDVLLTSQPDIEEITIFVSKDYRKFYKFEVSGEPIFLNQFEGFVIIFIPTYLDTPAILKTSFHSLKIYVEDEKVLHISNQN
ncbi:hypothetical protein TTHERM_00449720 (macronuclear) [Tetrahymena thermophila SB210]|uniref:Transmembrane protein n=1 Tax=Tetrahymena thermophila (strain SB210) TaxID=312017 RepID=Q238U8_TETTS|nr:hypothetical protein TTHERM_00449720 [Tetrahymena thermophila SB210]EAR93122.1 hypothetical protein TTHERM_00449720 [Tetrahymena thermophila SB210]|eukprot:XP_001013367.1 hypothetical protein TTHERM_00449720 [Tetrahymena thermophila SB210]